MSALNIFNYRHMAFSCLLELRKLNWKKFHIYFNFIHFQECCKERSEELSINGFLQEIFSALRITSKWGVLHETRIYLALHFLFFFINILTKRSDLSILCSWIFFVRVLPHIFNKPELYIYFLNFTKRLKSCLVIYVWGKET